MTDAHSELFREIPGAWRPPEPEQPLFVDVNAPMGVTDDFAQLVESFFREDIPGAYQRVEQSLKLGEDRADFSAVSEALDRAEDNARIAHRLFINAKVEQRRFEIEREAVEAGMWKEARQVLEEEKDQGRRSKAPTLDDVRYKMSELHPDEVAHLKLREEKIKRACDHLEQLADLAKGRCRTLQVFLSSMRK